MSGQVEGVHDAFPHGLTLECLADGNGLRKRSGTAIHALDSLSQLIRRDHHYRPPLGNGSSFCRFFNL